MLVNLSLVGLALATLTTFLSFTAEAQVATAPLVPDQRLINPAALTGRELKGYSLSFEREIDKSRAPDQPGSTIEVETSVDTVGLNFNIPSAPFFLEINFLPQFGNRNVTSGYVDPVSGMESDFGSKRAITSVPVQGLMALRLGELGSVGVKALYTSSTFSTDERVGYKEVDGIQNITTTGERSTTFLAASVGGVVDIFGTGLYVGVSSEMHELRDEINSGITQVRETPTGNVTTTTNENHTTQRSLRKNIFGVGFVTKIWDDDTWRIDFSREMMPSLDDAKYKDGKLDRLVTEITWAFFHVGLQVTSTTGYYIDPYNLIPYFFGMQDYNADSAIEYSFFGGLKSSKGHSFRVSYSQSNRKRNELLGGFQEVTLDSKETSYGLSYMYVF